MPPPTTATTAPFLGDATQRLLHRETQVQQLEFLLSPLYPSSPAIVVHGLSATGKTTILNAVLLASGIPHAVIQSKECVTGRHLLERTLASCIDATEAAGHEAGGVDRSRFGKCENLSALAVQLQKLLVGVRKFVLVLDGVDRQREATPTLLPALARLNEMIPCLTTVFVVSFPRHRFLHLSGVPHVAFSSYTRDEAIDIVSRSPLSIFEDSISTDNETAEDSAWLWTRFCAAVYDSLGKSATFDVVALRRLAENLWRPFVSSIVEGTHGPQEFSKLMVARRSLFQSEEMLLERVVVAPPASTTTAGTTSGFTEKKQIGEPSSDLPYFAKYLLCAAYLASYNPARTDMIHFSKTSERKKRRKKKKTTPGTGRVQKYRKIPRRLLHPSPFPLERLLAVFRAILPHEVKGVSVDLYTQLATLASLRLVTRGGGDALDAGARWKVNVGWEFAESVGKEVGLELAEWVFEG